MEKIIIQYLPEAEKYLNDLAFVLFQKDYFGFLEGSFDYVDDIVDFIEYNLPIFPFRNTPESLLQLGSKYIFYKANHTTTWYIFFENIENRYLVTFITNSHSEMVKHL